MTLACVRRPTCEARSAARKASPITYTPPWKYRTTWRGSMPSTVISAVGTPPSAAAVTVTSAGSGCADSNSRSSRRCSLTSLPTGKAECRRIASSVSRCSVLTEDLPFGWVGRQRSRLTRPRFRSGLDVGAVAEVEADRLHDPERGAGGEHVGRGEDSGVLLDDGCGSGLAAGVEPSLHAGPRVLAVLDEEGRGVDGVDRVADAGGDVGHVLLVHGHVVAVAEPTEVSTDEVLPRVGEGVGRRLDVAGDVLGEVGDVDGRPPGVDDVHEHEGVVVWQMDVDVVGRVIGAVPGQVDALAADLQAAPFPERLLRRGPRRVVVAHQEAARLLVADAHDILVEQERGAGVVGVVVGVDEVGDLVAQAVRCRDLGARAA